MRLRTLAGPSRKYDWLGVLPGQRWRRMRDSNSRGVAPNTLPTMLASVHRGSPQSANWANTIRGNIGERLRTGMNGPKTEPGPGPGLGVGAESLESSAACVAVTGRRQHFVLPAYQSRRT